LHRITTLGVQGAVYPQEILPQAAEAEQITLKPRMLLTIGLTPGQASGDMPLCCTHNVVNIPLLAVDEGRGAIAVAHYHLWRNLPAGAPLRFELHSPDATPRAFEIPRAGMAEHLGALLHTDLAPGEDTLMLAVLEHLHHGGFLPHLSPTLQERAH